ncbi:MAG: hypothetical protein COB04_18225 [Gammaproteobacteria bacterium]|nr:MAG: hypothetical protein COB04_18225 [Gammaproteobacteria bacterium]
MKEVDMIKVETLPPILSPYVMAKPEVLEEVLDRYSSDPEMAWRVTYIRTMNRLLAPARWIEERFFNANVRKTELASPPLMILGHWRSGTTHLHYTLAQDPQFATISNAQIGSPTCYFSLGHWLTRLAPILPHIKRPMDNLPMGIELPQEEELAMPALTTATLYYYWMFPREFASLFDQYCLFKGEGSNRQQDFLEAYHFVLQQATYADPGKTLLLKNPPSTARLALLADHYPDSKFVHIHRNPYDVYRSSQRLFDKMSSSLGLQTVSPEQRDEMILHVYDGMMNTYLAQRNSIPSDRLIEIRYEDLEINPMKEIKGIYEQLDLPGWDDAERPIQAYLKQQRNYQKNDYVQDPDLIRQVNQRWEFAFGAFGYEMQDTPTASQLRKTATAS